MSYVRSGSARRVASWVQSTSSYGDLELDAKVELIRSLVPLGLMHLDDEVTALAGARYAQGRLDRGPSSRQQSGDGGPRGAARANSCPPDSSCRGGRDSAAVPRVAWRGRGQRPAADAGAIWDFGNYAAAAEAIPGAIGLSGSTVSRTFIQASAAKLHEFHERDLSNENVVAIVLDGKTFAEATMVIALGITMTGEKRFLGFVETDTENAQVLTALLERGLDISPGVW